MENVKKELINLQKEKIYGIVLSPNKTNNEVNLLKVKKDLERTRQLRNYILKIFENDTLEVLRTSNIDFLSKIPFPILFDYKTLFKDQQLVLKLFADDYFYTNCFFSKDGTTVTSSKSDVVLREMEIVLPYVAGLFRVNDSTNILNNSFYDNISVLLFNQYIKKIIINGDGIKLSLDNINLDSLEKRELLNFYYDNYKRILKNIKVKDTKEFENYRNNVSKRKILEIYRG